ncbi:hypothetical protein KGM_204469 [Danaus plexippus plexippus]|uniref:Uncharacterized protein n=1 Tax=Danaus plexippus plexippus TaxID=278856 RepID=A0A212EXK1_DANPL|nr:hypothetical protein KGM_204469 [Danaus plexippus plexippus]
MVPGASSQIRPPVECRPIKIPPNPCCPRFHQANWRKYKLLFFLVCLPLILIQCFNTCGHKTPDKGECRDFEYMRLRFKKYPWRDGIQTFFHNERVNHVPGECTPPPLDCD